MNPGPGGRSFGSPLAVSRGVPFIVLGVRPAAPGGSHHCEYMVDLISLPPLSIVWDRMAVKPESRGSRSMAQARTGQSNSAGRGKPMNPETFREIYLPGNPESASQAR